MVMRLVVLDGHTLNPGDLSWRELEALGELTVHARSAPAEVAERIADADIVFTNKTPLSAELIQGAPKLRYIGVLATGFNIVEVDAASARGIPVCNARGYGSESVAQAVFGLILNFSNHTAAHGDTVTAGDWAKSPDFCYWTSPLLELQDRTLGIIGPGAIGRATARIAQGFGMNVIASTRDPSRPAPAGVTWRTVEQVFAESDFVSLHCPLTPETEKLVDAGILQSMKSTAFLINTSRGPLIDEPALADALWAGTIAGAGLDVLSVEPPPADHPLFNVPNCVITPHIAWATQAARSRLVDITVENLRQFLAGTPTNQVNP